MTITLYNVSETPNCLTKTLTGGMQRTAVPVEPCDFLTPTFIIDSANKGYNYCVAGEPLNRSYFINNTSLLTGQRAAISCTVDVLGTYAAAIKKCAGTFLRSENPYTRYMYDNKLPLTGQMTVRSTLFPQTPFTASETWNYLMYVVGKEGV